jgi:transaldolase
MNRLQQLTAHGQSIWLDYISRGFVTGGELRRMIAEDGVTGMTSNPTLFDEAIGQGDEYESAIDAAARRTVSAEEAYNEIVVADVQAAADELRGVFERTQGRDGYVSLEVSPHLAYDTERSVAQAREFWQRLARPNVFVKIPGTREGVPAIRRSIAAGININVTLLFGLPRYRAVAEAYMAALEDRISAGEPVDRVRSVASFFLSRIDVLVDPKLDEIADRSGELSARARALRGRTAIASAKLAYQVYKELFDGERFRRLAHAGARPQLLLWGSTSTKNPQQRDVRYVEALIGPDTINTMPLKTLRAFRDHGDATPRLEEDIDGARAVLRELAAIGIDLDAVSDELEKEGVRKFIEPFDRSRAEIGRRLAARRAQSRSGVMPQ